MTITQPIQITTAQILDQLTRANGTWLLRQEICERAGTGTKGAAEKLQLLKEQRRVVQRMGVRGGHKCVEYQLIEHEPPPEIPVDMPKARNDSQLILHGLSRLTRDPRSISEVDLLLVKGACDRAMGTTLETVTARQCLAKAVAELARRAKTMEMAE